MKKQVKPIKSVKTETNAFRDSLLAGVREGQPKIKASFTLDNQTYLDFREACKEAGVPMSPILEKMMQRFVKGD